MGQRFKVTGLGELTRRDVTIIVTNSDGTDNENYIAKTGFSNFNQTFSYIVTSPLRDPV